MERFQYKIESTKDLGTKSEDTYLNQQGTGGWELCSVLEVKDTESSYKLFYWKRKYKLHI